MAFNRQLLLFCCFVASAAILYWQPPRVKRESPASRRSDSDPWALESVLDTYHGYRRLAHLDTARMRTAYERLDDQSKRLGSGVGYPAKLARLDEAETANADLAHDIAELGAAEHGLEVDHTGQTGTLFRVREAMQHFARDWSTEGAAEREKTFRPILDVLQEASGGSVLVPGSGLGRLAWDISQLGFETTANELSHYMNIPLRFLLNEATTPAANVHCVHPWAHRFSHQRETGPLFRAISFPDTVPRRSANFNVAEGDFMQHSRPDGGYDFIVTLFFIDTSANIAQTLIQIYTLLAPGGTWINLGPLLWAGGGSVGLELSLEEVKEMTRRVGLRFDVDAVRKARTVESTSLTPHNPLRVIAHCDIDAAYAQFEAVRLGYADDVPLIVIQWDTIIAVNYPARKYGIKRTSRQGAKEARELCPHVIIAHTATYRPGEEESGYWDDANVLTHKVSLDPYRRESAKIMAIFREMVPKGEVEKASIDEAYMDYTPMVLDKLLELHPHLSSLPVDAPEGLDTPLPPAPPIDWTGAGNVVPVQPAAEEGDVAETQREIEKPTWEDWALCIGAEIMAEVRAEVWKRLHYTCSAGIAHNKAMAKLCSSWRKPNNQTVLRHSAVSGFLHDKAFTDIRNLGGKLGHSIAAVFEAATVGELVKISLDEMQQKFGEESIWVYNLIRGIDHTDLTPRYVNKTMLASKNIIPPIRDHDGGLKWIDLLCGELCVRLRESRELAPGLWPRTVVLTHRSGRGYINAGKSRQMPFPYTKELSGAYIAKYCRRMWRDVAASLSREGGGVLDVHNLGVQFSSVERLEEGQQNIEGFFGSRSNRGDIPGTGATSQRGEPSRPTSKRSRSTSISRAEHDLAATTARHTEGSQTVWTCPKCHKVFRAVHDEDDLDASVSETHLAGIKQEHEDYHFALDLQQSGGGHDDGRKKVKIKQRDGRDSGRQGNGRDGSIASFFVPRPKS